MEQRPGQHFPSAMAIGAASRPVRHNGSRKSMDFPCGSPRFDHIVERNVDRWRPCMLGRLGYAVLIGDTPRYGCARWLVCPRFATFRHKATTTAPLVSMKCDLGLAPGRRFTMAWLPHLRSIPSCRSRHGKKNFARRGTDQLRLPPSCIGALNPSHGAADADGR